jgi:AcrR family transcriptional regulator
MPMKQSAIEERQARKLQELVDDSARVFAQRGYHNTTLDDIVEATGMTRGGLYHYIDGKKDLLVASHARYLKPLLAELSEIDREELPADDAIVRIVDTMMETHATYPDHVAVFLRDWQALEGEPEWKELRRDRRRFEGIVAATLERGREEGIFEFEDVSLVMYALLGMVNYANQWFNPAGRVSAEVVARSFAEIFLDGIRPD